jgi:Zn-dependent protease with chaperone function
MLQLGDEGQVRVRRWPTERILLMLNAVASAGMWFLFFRSIQSIVYIAMSCAFLLLMNIASIAAIRGSAVRLSAEQFPDLHARVADLARRMGLRRTPDVFLMQQDGALNAFATRFMRMHMVVLLSDLLEACGDNAAARDMIIGHELGHIRAGHLRARWLLMPGSFVPFLGSALSRARELTCDRYGFAAAGDRDGALTGLAILAAGPKYGPQVNIGALMRQRHDLRSAWMMIGEWLGSHPPLSKRVWALAPDLEAPGAVRGQASLFGLRIAFAAIVVVVIGTGAAAAYLPQLIARRGYASPERRPPDADAIATVDHDLHRLKAFIEDERKHGRPLPWDDWDLYARWEASHPKDKGPLDPFSGGYWYSYQWHGDSYRLWSEGPDGENHTADDLVLDGSRSAVVHRRYVSRAEQTKR